MSKTLMIIKYDDRIRCKVTDWCNSAKYMECTIQVKIFLWWKDVYHKMFLSEGFWGENFEPTKLLSINPLRYTCIYGDITEAWATGTLNIEERIREFIKEYVEYVNNKRRFYNKFEKAKKANQ